MFPISLGIEFNLVKNLFSPYLSIDEFRSFISSFLETSPPKVWYYLSIDEIPAEFKKIQETEKLQNNSYGIIFGAGTTYQISPKINLDIRYQYQYDFNIENIHHFMQVFIS